VAELFSLTANMRAPVKCLAFLLSGIAVAGCDRAFTEKPKVADLVGTYSLSKSSEDFLHNRKGYVKIPESEIALGSDQTVTITNLPDCATNGFGKSSGAFLSGEGRWEIEKGMPGWVLTLDIKRGGSLSGGVYTGCWMCIRGRSAPYRLGVTIGDPDSDETLLYEKKDR
jgi:hypothetical protein